MVGFIRLQQLTGGLAQVAVCTPGRMIDLIKMKACTMMRATFLVFDEADRMFDMGFEPQVVLPKSSDFHVCLLTVHLHVCRDLHHVMGISAAADSQDHLLQQTLRRMS